MNRRHATSEPAGKSSNYAFRYEYNVPSVLAEWYLDSRSHWPFCFTTRITLYTMFFFYRRSSRALNTKTVIDIYTENTYMYTLLYTLVFKNWKFVSYKTVSAPADFFPRVCVICMYKWWLINLRRAKRVLNYTLLRTARAYVCGCLNIDRLARTHPCSNYGSVYVLRCIYEEKIVNAIIAQRPTANDCARVKSIHVVYSRGRWTAVFVWL